MSDDVHPITQLKVYRDKGGNHDEYGPEVELPIQEVDDFARETAVDSGAYAVPLDLRPVRPNARSCFVRPSRWT